ncbi:MAG: hypothetical protein LWX56_00480 [Ignavibacteria bacterium]|nr:hypothetical protein [Ignavibacteria bacterium]
MNEEDDIIVQYKLQLLTEERTALEKNSQVIQDFQRYCNAKGLDLQAENFQYIQSIGIVVTYPNLLNIIYPELPIDKEGLVDLDYFVVKRSQNLLHIGRLLTSNFEILLSPYFRRGYNERSNYNPFFVYLFQFNKSESLSRSILLDMNRVRIDIDGPICGERDAWFGARFNEKIENIKDGITKLRPPSYISESHISFFFREVYSLDIKWETKNNIKTFQLEEFKTEKVVIDIEDKQVYPVRYLHAEYDIDHCKFRHFDGAIHFYTREEYFARRDSDFNYNVKNISHIKSDSIKLFKINGKISVKAWVELASHYLYGNPLIIEYYEGKYPKNIEDFLARLKELGRGA